MKAVVKHSFLAFCFLTATLAFGEDAKSEPRFEKFDGYAKDKKTNLLWQIRSGKNQNDRFSYTGAKKECENLVIDGKKGWRVPEFVELKALADTKNNDTIGFLKIFTDTNPKYYRSNTSAGDFTNAALVVGFKMGSEAEVPNSEMVFLRCVREDK